MTVDNGLTPRSLAFGSFFGVLLCVANTLFGLQSGWVTMASIQSAVLSFGAWKAMTKLWPNSTKPFTIAENVVSQTVAVAAATMPLAAGFVGIIPALRIIEARETNSGNATLSTPGEQIIWSFSLAFLGVFIASSPLCRSFVKSLVFPSGTATALAIRTVHANDPQSALNQTPGSPPVEAAATSLQPREMRAELVSRSSSSSSRPFPLQGDKERLATASAAAPFDEEALNPVANGTQEDPPLPSTAPEDAATPIASTSDAGPSLAASNTTVDASSSNLTVQLAERQGLASSFRLALYAFAASACLTLTTFFFPVLSAISVAAPLTAWGWTVNFSLAGAAQGIIMGLPTTLSMLVGAVMGFGIIGPAMQARGVITKPLSSGASGGRGFLTWIALSIMLSEALAGASVTLWQMLTEAKKRKQAAATEATAAPSLAGASHARSLEAALPPRAEQSVSSSPPSTAGPSLSEPEQVLPRWAWMGGLAGCCLFAVVALVPLASVSVGESLLAVVLSLPISVVAARSLGTTDLNPVSGLGKLSQLVFGALFPHSITANVIAGAVAEAGAQQAGDLLQDLRTGYLLRVPLRAQFYGQLFGSAISVFAATAAFHLFDAAYGIPSPSLPAPSAAVWVAMADLMSGAGTGKGGIPAEVLPIAIVAAVLSFVLTILMTIAETAKESNRPLSAFSPHTQLLVRLARFFPSPTALAIGLYISPSWTLPRVVGAACAALLARRGTPRQLLIMAATGFVLGEGLLALVTAGFAAIGVRPLSCGGCSPGTCGNFCP